MFFFIFNYFFSYLEGELYHIKWSIYLHIHSIRTCLILSSSWFFLWSNSFILLERNKLKTQEMERKTTHTDIFNESSIDSIKVFKLKERAPFRRKKIEYFVIYIYKPDLSRKYWEQRIIDKQVCLIKSYRRWDVCIIV